MPRKCEMCWRQPNFGCAGGRGPTRCREHAGPEMTNVVKARCTWEGGCDVHCSFGQPGRRAERCREHAVEGMVNVIARYSRRCEGTAPGGGDGEESCCPLQPSFGFLPGGEGDNDNDNDARRQKVRPTHCSVHRKEGMRNVVVRGCEVHGCEARPLYGRPQNERGSIPARCHAHREEGMVDVVSKLCDFEEEDGSRCSKHPVYGVENGRPTRCRDHAMDGMTNVKHKRCEQAGCNTFAFFGRASGERPSACERHAIPGMVNVRAKTCVTCSAASSYNPDFEGRCFRCFVYAFPESALVRNFRTKEGATIAFLRERFAKSLDMREDKRMLDGCSNYRPDIVFDLGDRVLVVEIDEEQHRGYDGTCENRRTMSLFQDANGRECGGRPLIIVRFNPDGYAMGKTHVAVPSCWRRTPKTGLLVVRDPTAWQRRLEALQDVVTACTEAPVGTLKEVHEVKLFYDGHVDA